MRKASKEEKKKKQKTETGSETKNREKEIAEYIEKRKNRILCIAARKIGKKPAWDQKDFYTANSLRNARIKHLTERINKLRDLQEKQEIVKNS